MIELFYKIEISFDKIQPGIRGNARIGSWHLTSPIFGSIKRWVHQSPGGSERYRVYRLRLHYFNFIQNPVRGSSSPLFLIYF